MKPRKMQLKYIDAFMQNNQQKANKKLLLTFDYWELIYYDEKM